MSSVSMSDILLLLQQDWVPEAKKKQLRDMILDTIDMAEQATKDLAKSMGGK